MIDVADVASAHDAMAEEYDSIDDLWYAHLYNEIHRTIVEHVPPGVGREALDVGCGTGFQSLLLSRAGYRVRGFDPASKLIDVAIRKTAAAAAKGELPWPLFRTSLPSFGVEQERIVEAADRLRGGRPFVAPEFMVGDADDSSSYRPGAYDVITCCGSVLSFIDEHERVLGRLAGALSNGGLLFLEVEQRVSLDMLWPIVDKLAGGRIGYEQPWREILRNLLAAPARNVRVDYPFHLEGDAEVTLPIWLFSTAWLRAAFRKNGLEVVSRRGIHALTNLFPSTVLHRPNPPRNSRGHLSTWLEWRPLLVESGRCGERVAACCTSSNGLRTSPASVDCSPARRVGRARLTHIAARRLLLTAGASTVSFLVPPFLSDPPAPERLPSRGRTMMETEVRYIDGNRGTQPLAGAGPQALAARAALQRAALAAARQALGKLPAAAHTTGYELRSAPCANVLRDGIDAFRRVGARLEIGQLEYAVVGRHSECDVRLVGDLTVALRHVLVRVVRGPRSNLLLEVRGLGDGHGVVTNRSHGVEVPLFSTRGGVVAVGSHILALIPTKGDPRAATRLANPARAAVAELPLAAPGLGPAPKGKGRDKAAAQRIEHSADASSHIEVLRTRKEDAAGCIVLSRGGEQARVWVSTDELAAGVLLGRYSDRCLGGAVAALLGEQISRTHCLLIGEPAAPLLYDLSSTNGTYLSGERIRAARLEREARAKISLASQTGVKLQWW